jgi:hypothetical protein
MERLGTRLVRTLVAAVAVLGLVAPLALAQDVLTAEPQTFGLTTGWYRGRETLYYDFGANTSSTEDGSAVIAAPIYALFTSADGELTPVEGQHNVIDVLPGQEGYSDLWQVFQVVVPDDYEADTVRSLAAIQEAGYEMTETDIYVNCPVVPAGSTLTEGGAPLVQGWYQDQEVFYFDFGANPPITAPIFAFITGFDAEENPQFVEGQHNVVDVIPGDPTYSAFWQVNLVQVPDDYEANTIRTAQEVMDSGFEIVEPGLTVNCPILRTSAQVATPQPTATMAATPQPTETPAGLQATPVPTPGEVPPVGAWVPAGPPLGWLWALGGALVAGGAGLALRGRLSRRR